MRKSVRSVGQKTRSEGPLEKPIDKNDWYEDWEIVGRGLYYSHEQDIIRCFYCRRDLMTLAPTPAIDRYITSWDWTSGKSGSWGWRKAGLPWMVYRVIEESQMRPICRKEECHTLWVIEGSI